jgi:endonuclease-3
MYFIGFFSPRFYNFNKINKTPIFYEKLDKKSLNIVIKELKNAFGSYKISPRKDSVLDTIIATKLSQNTTDKTAHIAYKNLKIAFPKWSDMLNAPLKAIEKEIRICGLAKTKAADIKNMLKQIFISRKNVSLEYIRKFDNDEVYNELLGFKGIGVKTASCVLSFALGREVFPVDTHIHRILNRIGALNSKTPEQTFELAKDLIPDKEKLSFHINLIKFGRNICKAQKPLCGKCYIYDYCDFKEKESYIALNRTSKGNISENNFIILENL